MTGQPSTDEELLRKLAIQLRLWGSIDPAQGLLDGRDADPPTQLEVQGAKIHATGAAGYWVITGADGREVLLTQDQARAIGPVMGRCSSEHAETLRQENDAAQRIIELLRTPRFRVPSPQPELPSREDLEVYRGSIAVKRGWRPRLPVERLDALDFVCWDRYATHERPAPHAVVYGWISRADGSRDFVLLQVVEAGVGYVTSSAKWTDEIGRRLAAMNDIEETGEPLPIGEGHAECVRVEGHPAAAGLRNVVRDQIDPEQIRLERLAYDRMRDRPEDPGAQADFHRIVGKNREPKPAREGE